MEPVKVNFTRVFNVSQIETLKTRVNLKLIIFIIINLNNHIENKIYSNINRLSFLYSALDNKQTVNIFINVT